MWSKIRLPSYEFRKGCTPLNTCYQNPPRACYIRRKPTIHHPAHLLRSFHSSNRQVALSEKNVMVLGPTTRLVTSGKTPDENHDAPRTSDGTAGSSRANSLGRPAQSTKRLRLETIVQNAMQDNEEMPPDGYAHVPMSLSS